VPRVSLTLVAKILPVLGGVAIGVYLCWCVAIALVGGTIPLIGWTLDGGFGTFLLWGLIGNTVVSGVGRLGLLLVIFLVGRVTPLSFAMSASEQEGDSQPVDVPLPGYHGGLASLCALASMLAYKPAEECHRVLGPNGLSEERIKKIEQQNHSCTILGYDDFIVVAFRGTDVSELADWKTNWHSKPVQGPWGLVHGGYLAAVDLLWNDVSAAVRQLRHREQKLLMTGHSMGGALAVLAAARFEMDGTMAVESIYTFGQPAVAEPAFTSELERRLSHRYFRFVHSVDSIPNLHVDIALKHGGQQVFIDRGGRMHVEESTFLMASERLVVAALTSDNRNIEVADHGIAEYLRVLSAPVLASTTQWAPVENRHHYVSAALYAFLFVSLSVLAWRAPTGAQSFAMGTGAGLLLVTLGLMFFCRQPFNDYLLNWYRSHKLVS